MIKSGHGRLIRHGGGWDILINKTVLSGLMFAGVGSFGLYVSRNYPIGSTLEWAPATFRVCCAGFWSRWA